VNSRNFLAVIKHKSGFIQWNLAVIINTAMMIIHHKKKPQKIQNFFFKKAHENFLKSEKTLKKLQKKQKNISGF
jgi:hypothetical protein